jgi:hypothetical protein
MDAPVDQPARDRRRRFGSKSVAASRDGEIAGVRLQQRLVQSLAEFSDHRGGEELSAEVKGLFGIP